MSAFAWPPPESVPAVLILHVGDVLLPAAIAPVEGLSDHLAANPLPPGEYVAVEVPNWSRFMINATDITGHHQELDEVAKTFGDEFAFARIAQLVRLGDGDDAEVARAAAAWEAHRALAMLVTPDAS